MSVATGPQSAATPHVPPLTGLEQTNQPDALSPISSPREPNPWNSPSRYQPVVAPEYRPLPRIPSAQELDRTNDLQTSLNRLELQPLVSCYVGEENGDCAFGRKYEQDTGYKWHVQYLTDSEKEPYRVTISESGILLDSSQRPLNTTVGSNFGGAAMFIMDANGDFLVSTHEEDGKFQHSSLASGMPVAMAGEMRVERGRISYISNSSGHYRPNLNHMNQCIIQLRQRGVKLRGVEVDLYGRRNFTLRR